MRSFNICLLSDIHLKENYLDKEHPVVEVFKSFGAKFKSISKNTPIDCVVVAGDLAFKGDLDEYSKLYRVLNKWIPQHIPVISVVGNHDVKWSEMTYALKPGEDLGGIFKLKNNIFFEQPRFKDVFVNFRDKIIDSLLKERCKELVKKGHVAYKYDKEAYVGYLHFKQNGILFLMLNSSWKSFGPGVISEFYDRVKAKLGADQLKKLVIGDSLSQRGKQSYFLKRNQFPYWDDINGILNEKPDTKIITVAHHPPSWLEWKEQFMSSKKREIRLDSLLKRSHILITGHEHVPMISEPILLPNGCHNVQMGSFLDYHFIDNEDNNTIASKFPSNWFGILKIEPQRFELESYKLEISDGEGGIDDDPKYNWVKKAGPFKKRISKKPTKEETEPGLADQELSLIAEYILPLDSTQLQSLVFAQRKNVLKTKKHFEITDGGLFQVQLNGEDYIIALNTLGAVYDKIRESESFEALIDRHSFFKELYDFLTSKGANITDLAFYDFIDPTNKLAYENFYNEQHLRFQSFKHDFFGKFKKFYIFRELNINYDCFIIES
ncbi:metallophosphoesterase family protein [Flagellimonas pacifica]|uniref:Calcineurin-like phosphoesterase n=1 Tax=Flagellimonas pacifica TaxID=1247520 RepID=A0A285N0Y8_9FLAO|nr:metallophosphoesterase family protein [Allomuricauda parva]SNZ01676.1 Calcineurin-like phosphoesterase [Allomuricauda parva]